MLPHIIQAVFEESPVVEKLEPGMLINGLRQLRHGPLRALSPLWLVLGNIYRRLISGLGLSVLQYIGPYGPFRLDARFAFSNFEKWGRAHNDGFVNCVEACRGRHCVLDVGAHIGLVSLPVASVMSSDGKLISFEPATANREMLDRHLKLNKFDQQVRIVASLVGPDSRPDIEFHEMDEVSGMNSLTARSKEYHQVRRDQISLDDFCEQNKLVPEVIKIDVEGAELGVLEGAHQILHRHKPVIFLSVHPWQIAQLGRSTDELANMIESLGYDCRHSNGSTVTNFALREYILTPRNCSG